MDLVRLKDFLQGLGYEGNDLLIELVNVLNDKEERNILIEMLESYNEDKFFP